MRYMSLFCGVGMFDYAFTQLGWTPVVASDCDEFCKRVYQKHYPQAKWYDDVRDITYERLKPREETTTNQPTGIDVICGGFPCQDLSVAGKQAGVDAERSGLWGEFARIIGEIRPRYVIVENVSALLTGDSGAWMRRVLGDLAEIGFDAEWHCIPAGNADGCLSAGAPHRRERVWIVAYPRDTPQRHRTDGDWLQENEVRNEKPQSGFGGHSGGNVPNPRHTQPQGRDKTQADNQGCSGEGIQTGRESTPPCDASDTASQRGCGRTPSRQDAEDAGQLNGSEGRAQPSMGLLAHGVAAELSRSRWLPEPRIGRVATGVPDRVNKLKALGNGLVWQIPYAIGRAIMEKTT